MFRWLLGNLMLVILAGMLCAPVAAAPPDAASDEFFEKHIRPLLVSRC